MVCIRLLENLDTTTYNNIINNRALTTLWQFDEGPFLFRPDSTSMLSDELQHQQPNFITAHVAEREQIAAARFQNLEESLFY